MKILALIVSILIPTLTVLTAVEDIPFLFGVSIALIPIWFTVLVILAHEEAKGRL
jgi:hypothetical protein